MKGREIIFACDTPTLPHRHCYEVSFRYSIWLPSYGGHKGSLKKKKKKKKKTDQREVLKKLRKGEQFLYVTRLLDLIHITLKFGQNIPYSYLVMAHTRKVYAATMDNVIT